MIIRPSEIYYSQDSISNVFDKNCRHPYQPIGETFDALYEGRLSVNDIPPISVKLCDNKWFTADNRRLWVFRNLERFGLCPCINVNVTDYISPGKFTTVNGGVTIYVRGFVGGRWYKEPAYQIQNQVQDNLIEDTRVMKQVEKKDEGEMVDNGAVEEEDDGNFEETKERREKEKTRCTSGYICQFNNELQSNKNYFIVAIIVIPIVIMIYKLCCLYYC